MKTQRFTSNQRAFRFFVLTLAIMCRLANLAGAQTAQSVLVRGQDWLNGQGVDAYYNGSNTTNDWGSSYIGNTYVGEKWQCVELPQRLYFVRGWYTGSFPVSAAKQIYDVAGQMGMTAYANGGGYIPVPGDMVVLSGGSYGHVCVVDHVDSQNVYVVEQNWPGSGDRYTFTRSGNNGSTLSPRGSYSVRGVVHSPRNGNSAASAKLFISESDAASAQGQPGFCRYGPGQWWHDASGVGDGGHMFWTYNNAGHIDNMADWRPIIADGGTYEIYVFIPRLNATTRHAHYEVYHADGRTDVIINQYNYSDAWVSLGRFRFITGTSGYLRLTDLTGEADTTQKVGFDAAQWQRR